MYVCEGQGQNLHNHLSSRNVQNYVLDVDGVRLSFKKLQNSQNIVSGVRHVYFVRYVRLKGRAGEKIAKLTNNRIWRTPRTVFTFKRCETDVYFIPKRSNWPKLARIAHGIPNVHFQDRYV